jgi:threonine dehydrogenase-like Zn-dependent dehydrogenase
VFAAITTEYNKVEWKQTSDPVGGNNQVIIKTGYAGICGSDQHIFAGDFSPRTQVPLIQGHEFGGSVVDVGTNVKNYKVGDRVVVDPIIWCGECPACKIDHYPACTKLKLLGVDMDGGFGEYVAADESMLYRIDDSISDIHAPLIELLSIGFHANNRAQVQPNDTIVIWGAGRVGQAILQAAFTKTQNTIFMVDVLDNRLEIATNFYPNVVPINTKKHDPLKVIFEHTNGRGVDVAFEAVGHAKSVKDRFNPVRSCVKSIRGAGTVCVLGLADGPVDIVMKELIWGEATLVASRVSHGEFREVIENMQVGLLKPEAFISKILPASEAQSAYEMLAKEPQNYLKVLLKVEQ